MKIDLTFLGTKVAKRVFTLFILCALVPILALALVSFGYVKEQLEKQGQIQLHQSCKSMGMSIFERLSFLEQQLEIFLSSYRTGSRAQCHAGLNAHNENLKKRFKGLAIVTDSKGYKSFFGDIQKLSAPSREQQHHLKSGKAIILTQPTKGNRMNIYMMRQVDPKDQGKGTLLAEINPMYLWGLSEYDTLPSMTEVHVFDQSNSIIYSTIPLYSSFSNNLALKINKSSLGQFEWKQKEEEYLASFWSIPLKFKFFHLKWTVVMSKSKADVFALMNYFSKTFPFVIILAFLVVFFFSTIQIRKTMSPIEILRDATQKIATGVFDHKVKIKSGDEFESLNDAFNQMSKKIVEGQALLVRSAKLSAIGQMGAGIIHEVKQPLTAIHGLLELSLMDENPGESKERLEATLGQVKRLNNMLGRFKSFSHMSEENMESLSLIKIIVQVYNLFEHQFHMRQIHCHIESKENLPDILADKQGLQQVLSNLLINAMDAVEEKNNGERIINIKPYSSEGKVFVEIEDNGCGIPEEIQARIFDPFLTTKDENKGTGLGMAIVESILHKHKATIEIESEVGIGTKFTLVFPALAQTVH